MIKKYVVYFKGLYYTGAEWNNDVSAAWHYDTYGEARKVARQLSAVVMTEYVEVN